MSSRSRTRHRACFLTYSQCEACSTCMLLPLHIASPANHHIESGFGQRHGDGSCVIREIDRWIGIFDVISLWKTRVVPILLCVSVFLTSVTKSWDMVFCQCLCKGRTHHAKVLEPKWSSKTANKLDFSLPISVRWESKTYISNEIY